MQDIPRGRWHEGLVTDYSSETSFDQLQMRAENVIQRLATDFGCVIARYVENDLYTNSGFAKVSFEQTSPKDFYKTVLILADELKKYPDSYILASQLGKIVVVQKIIEQDETNEDIVTDGFTAGQAMYIAIGSYDKRAIKQVFHHELEHVSYRALASEHVASLSAAPINVRHTTKRRWHEVNSIHDLRYSDSWTEMDNPTGFAQEYGSSSMEEDRATMMEFLMTDPKGFEIKCSMDTAFAQKAELLKQDLYWRSNGEMDNAYFARLATRISN